MEIKLRLWIGSLAAVCFVVAISAIREQPILQTEPRVREAIPLENLSRELRGQLDVARTALYLASVKQAAQERLSNATDDHLSLDIVTLGDVPTQLVVEIERRMLLDGEAPTDMAVGIPTIVAVVGSDWVAQHGLTAPRYSQGNAWIVPPTRTNGQFCLVGLTVMHEDVTRLDEGWPVDEAFERIAGLGGAPSLAHSKCRFYSAFGEPGPLVQEWLTNSRYRAAAVADWDQPLPVIETLPRVRVGRTRRFVSSWGYAMTYIEAFDQMACADGRPKRCRIVLAALTPQRSNDGRRAVSQYFFTDRLLPLRPPVAFFLSDLVRDVGPERFQDFWRSDQPFEVAFETAAGRDIGEWTADWTASRTMQTNWGPDLNVREVLLALSYGLIAALVSLLVANRVRQKA